MPRLPTFLVAAAVALAPACASAGPGGIDLSWGDCGAFGQLEHDFACNTNVAVHSMIGSALAPLPMPQLQGQVAILDLITNQPALSPWWQMGAGECRWPSGFSPLNGVYNFVGMSHCGDAWGAAAEGSVLYQSGSFDPNRARMRTMCAIPTSVAIDDVTEYYLFKLSFTSTRTVGIGACTGCADGACIVLKYVVLTQPAGVGDYTLTSPIQRAHVLWQGGGAGVVGGCPGATPARASTWGSVKSLYR